MYVRWHDAVETVCNGVKKKLVLLELGQDKFPVIGQTEKEAKELAAEDALMNTHYTFKNVPPQLACKKEIILTIGTTI